MINIFSLHHYPIKGCRGISSESLSFDNCGFIHDRRWMIVDATGRFISQRSKPILAKIEARCTSEGLILSAPGATNLEVERPTSHTESRVVSIWNDQVEALTLPSASPSHWLSNLLHCPADLVYLAHPKARPIREKYGPGYVSFADTLPFLLTNTASLDDLNSKLASPVSMDRFRPNIVIRSEQPFAEHDWTSLRIGDLRFVTVKPCVRCQVPTIDQCTGEKTGREPMATLAKYRNIDGKVIFGQLLKPLDSGTIHIGQTFSLCPIE